MDPDTIWMIASVAVAVLIPVAYHLGMSSEKVTGIASFVSCAYEALKDGRITKEEFDALNEIAERLFGKEKGRWGMRPSNCMRIWDSTGTT